MIAAQKVKWMEHILFGIIPPGVPISRVCDGSPWCDCSGFKPTYEVRTPGGTLLSKYKQGVFTAETRAANAAYMREYRARKKNNGTA